MEQKLMHIVTNVDFRTGEQPIHFSPFIIALFETTYN